MKKVPSRADVTIVRNDGIAVRDATPGAPSATGGSGAKPSPTDALSVQTGEKRILKGRFVLEERIGSGGMGTVFRAKDLRKVEARDDEPYIAVKVLNADFQQHPEAFIALQREASKSQTLRHPNIVSIFDFDKDGDLPYITMELLDGRELAELLQAYPAGLPEEMAWQIIRDVVAGLMHAHEQGVVHADFKPGNVFVTRTGTKILDFGIARAVRMNPADQDRDVEGLNLQALTPAYASREMLNGDNAEPRDDLYALGVVMYLVLTGCHPYGRVPADEAVKEDLRPDRIKSLSRRRWRIIESCLAFNRRDRPVSAAEVYEGLFGRVPWRAWSVAASLAIVSLTLALSVAFDSVEISEVKEEVRTETLVLSQVERINDLLADPEFNAEWRDALLSEVQTLKTVAPETSAYAGMGDRIATVYARAIRNAGSEAEAQAIYQDAAMFDVQKQLVPHLRSRLERSLVALVDMPLDEAWLTAAEETFGLLDSDLADDPSVQRSREQVVQYLVGEIERLVASNDEESLIVAGQAWQAHGQMLGDAEQYETLSSDLRSTLAGFQRARLEEQLARTRAMLAAQLDDVLEVSCLQLDAGAVVKMFNRIARAYPEQAGDLQEHAGSRIDECISRLEVLDPARAAELRSAVAPVLAGGLAGRMVAARENGSTE